MKSGHTDPNPVVRVSAPARLHLGFLDLNGNIGRKFGSVGLAIDSHHTVIEVSRSTSNNLVIQDTENLSLESRIKTIVTLFYETIGTAVPASMRSVQIKVIDTIPEHAGLGSGTQLTLAIGKALCLFHGVDTETTEIARMLGRGKRSGIGITTFDKGGFVVDAGLKPGISVPPAVIHHYFPAQWHIVMIMDNAHQGVHGSQEREAFQTLPEFPQADAARICHMTLMQLVPAVFEADLANFAEAVHQIQDLIGGHFAPAQGGDQYTSPNVASILRYASSIGHTGIAQSSWGPTGCVFVADGDSAIKLCEQLADYAQSQINDTTALSFVITRANQSGATIETTVTQSL